MIREALGKVLASFSTVRRAEQYIAQREETDPEGVRRGDYAIDASRRADAEYQRLCDRQRANAL